MGLPSRLVTKRNPGTGHRVRHLARGLPGGGGFYPGLLSVNIFDTLLVLGTPLEQCHPVEMSHQSHMILNFLEAPFKRKTNWWNAF